MSGTIEELQGPLCGTQDMKEGRISIHPRDSGSIPGKLKSSWRAEAKEHYFGRTVGPLYCGGPGMVKGGLRETRQGRGLYKFRQDRWWLDRGICGRGDKCHLLDAF